MKSLLPIVAIEAPSNLGLKPPVEGAVPGVYRLPDALRKTDLFRHLGIQEIKCVAAPVYNPEIDIETGIRNTQAIREYSIALADVIEGTIRHNNFPLVIGGDCSILLGSALALRRLGQYGLFFMDGHTDFQTSETSSTGGAAGMDLALATGYGSPVLTRINDYMPLIDEQCVIAFGFRDVDNPLTYPARLIFDTHVQLHSLDDARSKGIHRTVEGAINHLKQKNVNGIWLHIDADVLDDTIMPAVDSRQPGGLTYDELTEVIQTLLKSELLVGLQVTILDPELDSEGQIVETFAHALAKALRPS